MSIKLSNDVKTIILEMLKISVDFKLNELNSVVLFKALLVDRIFFNALEQASMCNKTEILNYLNELLTSGDLSDKEVESKGEKEIFQEVLKEANIKYHETIKFSQELAIIFSYANLVVQEEQRSEITIDDIILSMIDNKSDDIADVFEYLSTDLFKFKEIYETSVAEKDIPFSIPKSLSGCLSILNDKFSENPNCTILGRDNECKEIWKTMMKKTKRNVLLIGEPGVGKSSVVYKLTYDILNGTCPEMFKDFLILSLNVNNLVSGTIYRGQAEERYKDLIELLEDYENLILFIDEIHMIVGAGSSSSEKNEQDFSNALKPILAGDEAIIIGATTTEEYKKTFGMEGALRRRFRNITIKEPKTTEVYAMLKDSIKQLEEFHGVKISKRMVNAIIFYSSCFNYNTKNPDRTKDLIDLSMVTAKMDGKDHVDRESIMKNFGANFEEFRNMSEEMVRSTAYHEVGHFIVQRFSDKLIDRKAIAISIVPAEGYLGLTVTDATDKTVNKDKSYFTDLIADLLAGRIAEKLFMKSENNAGAESDLEKATKIAFKMVTKYGMASRLGENQIYLNDKDYQMQTPAVTEIVNREVQKILEEAAKKATLVLDEHQEVVEELVNELTKKGMLSGKELNSIIELYEQKQAVTV